MSDPHSSPPLTIAVAGGTGTVGKHVVDVARRRGHEVVVLSRRRGTDLVAGTGLDDALRGVDVVIDVTSQATQDSGESRAFFGAVTRHLLAAEARTDVGHHVALSIVGIDEAPTGYYAGKALQEELVEQSPVLFRRTALTCALPVPVLGCKFGELWSLLNVDTDHRAVLAGVLMAELIPDIPHTVVALLTSRSAS